MMVQRVCIVTGCTQGGMGYALCEALAAQGCTVYATGRKLEQMQGLVALGCRLQQLDVTDEAAVARVVQAVVQEAGRIDILINNAGMTLKGWAIETPMTKARSVMEVNYFGMLAMTQAVAPIMIKQRQGTIVNTSSIACYMSSAQNSAYCATKSAVRAYSDSLRPELAPFNVHVVHVAPGYVKTRLFKQDALLGQAKDSPYSQFEKATRLMNSNPADKGLAKSGIDADVFARRLVAALLRPRPPMNYHDGTAWRLVYYLGCFAPTWLQLIIQRVRFGLF